MRQRYLQKIDTKTTGNRYDVTPVFADPVCLNDLLEDMVKPFQNTGIDCVAGIDALGFILGTAVATRLGVGFIPIRKGGKLPVETLRVEFVDYSKTQKSLEVRKDAFYPDQRILLVDEWIETGAQIKAAIRLIEALGATVVGIATINMDANEDTQKIANKYTVNSIWNDA